MIPRKNIFSVLILAGFAVSLIGACESKGNSLDKPLVYLIPEEYVGPVFVFFGQEDGVETMLDPLGKSVLVPKNGVIKLKGKSTDLIGKGGNERQNIYWIQVLRSGQRRPMIVSNNTAMSNDGSYFDSYYDELGKLHRHVQKGSTDPFHYFSAVQKKERMIFEHGSCKHQKFSAPDVPEEKWPACGKFLVISPNEYFKKPAWLWDETSEEYRSIADFEIETATRANKIKAFVK